MKTLWGVGAVEGNAPDGYPRLFSRLVAEGWQAVECPVWRIADKAKFCAALSAAGLGYVAMINTCTPSAAGGGAAEPRPAQDLESHIASFEAQVAECLALPLRRRAQHRQRAMEPQEAEEEGGAERNWRRKKDC